MFFYPLYKLTVFDPGRASRRLRDKLLSLSSSWLTITANSDWDEESPCRCRLISSLVNVEITFNFSASFFKLDKSILT